MSTQLHDTHAADVLVPIIQERITRIEQLEIQLVNDVADLTDAETTVSRITNEYYARGLEGSNERIRQANLAELLQADGDYQRAEEEVRTIDQQVRYTRISIDSLKRNLSLEMEMLRHVRPSE